MQKPVTNIASYQTPFVALLNNEPVRLIATGDMEGHSPVCQYIDSQGKLGWASQDQFQIFDTNLLPPSREAIANALQALRRS
jgi:hypothetical protein